MIKVRLVYLVFLIFFTLIYLFVIQRVMLGDNKEPEVLGWERKKSRNTSRYISKSPKSALLRPWDEKKVFLRIFVVSNVENFERRRVIRDTWGNKKFGYDNFQRIHGQKSYLNASFPLKNLQKVDFQVIFVLGKEYSNEKNRKKIENEAKLHKDILQEDFIEHYSNLTLKTLYILKWTNILKATFNVKIDDDIFLNVPNLMHFLLGGTIPVYKALKYFYNAKNIDVTDPKNRLTSTKNVLIGDLWRWTPSLRNPTLKHYAPRYLYEKTFYPPFLSGYMFIMSTDVAKKLYFQTLNTPFFHLEDVFVTGIVAQNAGISRKNHHLLSFKRLGDMCGLKGIIAENGRDVKDFYRALEFILDEKNECPSLENAWILLYEVIFAIFGPIIEIWNNYKYWFPPKN